MFLITGGAGFIGSHIAHQLVRQGHRVRVLDNMASGSMRTLDDILDDVEFVEGDIRAVDALCRAVS
ncbi:MAG: NAD-dependent epimerase/dehydratase family protein, partial [Thermomicrobiales bacterium]